jgi:FkbM family methyltransferase
MGQGERVSDTIKRNISLLSRRLGYEVKRWRNPPQEQIDRNDPLRAAADFFRQHNVSIGTIFDVGANRGDFCAEALELFASATVYCFEPTADIFQLLKSRFGENPRVKMFENAILEADGTIKFFVRPGSVWNSLLRDGTSGVVPPAEREVDVAGVSLDSFTQRQGVDAIDLLKLDIQGAELRALRGAKGLLSNGKVGLIQLEVNFQNLYAGQGDLESISRLLFDCGYWFQGIYGASMSSGILLGADVLFAHQRYH